MYFQYTYTSGRFDKAAPEIYALSFFIFLFLYIWVKYKTYIFMCMSDIFYFIKVPCVFNIR